MDYFLRCAKIIVLAYEHLQHNAILLLNFTTISNVIFLIYIQCGIMGDRRYKEHQWHETTKHISD